MIDLTATIEAMKVSGMTSDEIVRALACVQSVEPVTSTRTPRQERNRRYYLKASEKRLKASEQDVSDGDVPSLEVSPAPLPKPFPSTHKENPPKGGQKKGSRLPADFAPDLDWATGHGLTLSQAQGEAAKFRDFWTAKAGQGGSKLDWSATWRNWVRSALERLPQSRAGPSPPQKLPSQADVFAFIGQRSANGQQSGQEDSGSVRALVPHLSAVRSG